MKMTELVLDADSRATARPCFGSDDVGLVRLRLRWLAQDVLNAAGTSPALSFQITEAGWMQRIDDVAAGRSVSVSVGDAGAFLYGRAAMTPRTPASNEKLVLSMALLDGLGPDFRMETRAAAGDDPANGVIHGDLWILGRGDPEVGGRTMRALARQVAASGISRVDGSVMGATTYFRRDWTAPGWNLAARDYVARPTALVFEGNLDAQGRDVRDPERLAAEALTRSLATEGVRVRRPAGSGVPPAGLTDIASVRSRRLHAILAKMLRPSDNFIAEVLGKRLGVEEAGAPGTIAKGAAAIEAFAASHQVDVDPFDSSGLSYHDRVTAQGLVRLLWVAEQATWGPALFHALPQGGQGTLRHRLAHVELHAKTGTLTGISALSGWVWLERRQTWGEFSILSSGMSKDAASEIEDRIVRILQNQAR
jgi:D-alanyl-D-alanine carboxypeptidase/D-alanyl-D-alanine-endopeptidase (penicillin-binding protein 4)